MVVTIGGNARGWLNRRLISPEDDRLVALWVRHAAARRPPLDVLWAEDLARLREILEPRAQEGPL